MPLPLPEKRPLRLGQKTDRRGVRNNHTSQLRMQQKHTWGAHSERLLQAEADAQAQHPEGQAQTAPPQTHGKLVEGQHQAFVAEQFAPGKRVRIRNLQRDGKFNNTEGTLVNYDGADKRWHIRADVLNGQEVALGVDNLTSLGVDQPAHIKKRAMQEGS